MKHKWYERNKVEDFTTLSTKILRAYRRFATYLFPDVIDFALQRTLDNLILTEHSTRPDLAPYNREAFRMAKAFAAKI